MGAGARGVLEVVAEAVGVAKWARDLGEAKGEIGGVGDRIGRVKVGRLRRVGGGAELTETGGGGDEDTSGGGVVGIRIGRWWERGGEVGAVTEGVDV